MPRKIDASELSAYLDGDLPPERMSAVEAAVASDPALRRHLEELLSDHRALGELALRQDEAMGDPPPRLTRLADRLTTALAAPHPRRAGSAAPWRAALRQAAALVAAAAIGWTAASWAAPHSDPLTAFIDEAAEVHRTAVLAPSFAREASPALIQSVGQLFAHKLTPPDLSGAGFTLSRIDVAAIDTGPAAVFFYTDPEARRLSLVLSMDSPILDALGRDAGAPRVTTHDGLAVSYGRTDDVVFALVGSVPEPTVRRLAARAATALGE